MFAVDATTIDMCLSTFWWAKFNTKDGIKVGTRSDLKTAIPEFVHIIPVAVDQVNVIDIISYQSDNFYVFDRGYTGFRRL